MRRRPFWNARCAASVAREARCAEVVWTPVVLLARYAGVVRRRVVLIAGSGQPDRVLRVIRIDARCAARDSRCA